MRGRASGGPRLAVWSSGKAREPAGRGQGRGVVGRARREARVGAVSRWRQRWSLAGPPLSAEPVWMLMPSWTLIGQGWWAHAFMIWGVTASNSVVMARGAASLLGWHVLEVVGADLLTVGLGFELIKKVLGLLRGLDY